MMSVFRRLGVLLLGGFCLTGINIAAAETIEIPYERFQLENGLTVIVHEDHKAPIVAVNVWYHVGSKDEKRGKTGFAHLFEHLMFNGSENYNDEFFKPFREVGATDMNGTTNSDRTNYFANVPSTAVEMALWMESDRMGHFLGVVDQARLDEQRGVVQNEKRQGENQPYGQLFNILSEQSYPADHPYSWSTIGSMEDLNAASLQDVHEWFKRYYGPNNAVVVLAGDITVAKAKALTQKYFAHIPASEPLLKKKSWVSKRSGERRFVAYDRVPQARVYMSWNVPPAGDAESDHLDLAAKILGEGKNALLYKRLVYQDQTATNISVFNWARELSGWFVIAVDVKAGVELERIEQAVNEELNAFLSKGPEKDILQRAKVDTRAQFVRGIERIGGFGGKSDMLAWGEVYMDNPGYFQNWLQRIEATTPSQIQQAARKWLSDGRLVLHYRPYPQYTHSNEDVKRDDGPPRVEAMPDLHFPDLQRATLSNGLRVILAERHEIPVVNMQLLLNAGYAADQGAKLGTGSFTLNMLDEGTRKYDALEIAAYLERLGARFEVDSDLDSSWLSMSALRDQLDETLQLFAELSLHSTFPQDEIDRLRGRWLAMIEQEKAEPRSMAWRVAPPLIYGENHAYAIPLTGSGSRESIQALTRADLQQFHKTWFRPDNATLIVVGDTSLPAIQAKLEKAFGAWKQPDITLPQKNIAQVAHPAKARVFLLDRPAAEQSMIIAAQLAPPENTPDRVAIDLMNDVIAGNFTARLNMNLREDKGWSYGARAGLQAAKGQSPYLITAPVQTDKTKQAIEEILKEYTQYREQQPAKSQELSIAIDNEVRSLPGKYETAAAVLNAIAYLTTFGYPDDYVVTYKDKVQAVTLDEVRSAAKQYLRPQQFTWVIVGDLKKIEAEIRALQLGEVHILSAEGKVIR